MKRKNKGYNVRQCVEDLNRLGLDVTTKAIKVSDAIKYNKLGNGTWGKIDFLINNGFYVIGLKDNREYNG